MEELNAIELKEGVELKETRSEGSRKYWLNLVDEFNQSGLSQKAFAELRGIKPKSLSKWKNDFNKSNRKTCKKRKSVKSKEQEKTQESVNFLSLELTDKNPSTEILEEKIVSDKILFRHRSGFTLELASGSNQELFKAGLLMLMELSQC